MAPNRFVVLTGSFAAVGLVLGFLIGVMTADFGDGFFQALAKIVLTALVGLLLGAGMGALALPIKAILCAPPEPPTTPTFPSQTRRVVL